MNNNIKKTALIILRDAVIACACLALAGFFINAVRPDGLPLIADKPYEIFVPCPETLGEVTMISPDNPRLNDGRAYIVDARSIDEFNAWHFADASCITYDYLDPISEDELKNISMNIIHSGKERLIVYGDGDGKQGSTGYELGRELAGHGIKNVFVVDGGAEALKGAVHE